ncbi:MAG: HlyD family efflux transporter periplasmic adaptor subunit [Lachnospiraceae bacterium]|nr:HlyD family efflux transporter periplasmic adaptor subunit [Lachnospiraceae bacterium]
MDKLKKREIIKNIAIVFLVIMLILTFFSNTIMNRTLPEVSTQSVTRASVTTQVRGEGVVEAEDPYNVVCDETRKVKSVSRRVGDHVGKDEVIYQLEGETSEELTEAKNQLSEQQSAYDMAILTSGLTNTEVAQVENGVTANTSTILAVLEQKDKEIADLQKKIDEYDAKIADVERQIGRTDYSSTPDVTKEQRAVDTAQEEYDDAKELLDAIDEYEEAQRVFDWYVANSSSSDPGYIEAESNKDKALQTLNNAKAKYSFTGTRDDAQSALNSKQSALDAAIKKKNDKLNSANNQSAGLSAQRDQLKKERDEVSAKHQNAVNDREKYFNSEKTKIGLEKDYQSLLQAKKKVDDLEKKALGGQILSPVAGEIISLGFTAGEKIEAGSTVAVIQVEGKGYKLSFPVSAKQARAVKVGDEVSVVNNWYYGDLNANLVAIQPDKSNARDGKILVFSLTGDSVVPGQSLTLSVGEKSSEYDLVVPVSALREDNNGKFVLIVDQRSTPFGSRYIAKRVDVKVLAEDDKVAALDAELLGYEYVITNSSKHIENKDQVKLAE